MSQLVVAVVFYLGLVARTQLVHLLLHLAAVLDACAVELDDDITLLDAGLLGCAAVGDLSDKDALVGGGDLLLLGLLGGQLGVLDSQHGALYGAILLDVGNDLLDRVAGHGEGAAAVVTRLGVDHRVDADELTGSVHQGTTGVAGVDGSVMLDEGLDAVVVAAALAQATSLGADDAGGDG